MKGPSKSRTLRPLHIVIVIVVTFGLVKSDFPQLHRALPSANGKPGYRVTTSTSAGVGHGGQDNRRSDKTSHGRAHSKMDLESERSWAYIYSIGSSVLVGLSGIFPLLVIPIEAGPSLKSGAGSARLRLLLSFAVGSLLGDVFLHLLPEAWATVGSLGADPHSAHVTIGLWVISGLLSFMTIEKIFYEEDEEDDENQEVVEPATKEEICGSRVQRLTDNTGSNCIANGDSLHQRNSALCKNGHLGLSKENGHAKNGNCVKEIEGIEKKHGKNGLYSNGTSALIKSSMDSVAVPVIQRIKVSGYLNLLANCIDNFTHGLAVAGSYLISPKVGMCTTIAILLHEIPHEVGDFAILLRSGFDRWKAAKAQIFTASGGVLGALTALSAESAEKAGDRTAWILPFTAGGFIYIALVTVVPDLLKEHSLKESVKQVVCVLAGVGAMLLVTLVFE